MKKELFFLLFIIGIISCTTTPLFTSKIKPSEVNNILCFEPISVISLIESKNKALYNDSVSASARSLHLSLLYNMKEKIRLNSFYNWQNSALNSRLRKEVQVLLNAAAKHETIDSVKITPVIDSLLETQNLRFALIPVANGFTRTKKNYTDQAAKSLALGAATLGMYTQVPVKCSSKLYVLIADAKENNLAFYRASDLQGKEPLDSMVLKKQYKNIFKGYF